MTTIYITRHGQTEWNLTKRLQGTGNSILTEQGKMQAIELRDRLNNEEIDVIYSSSLLRAIETSNIIKGERNINLIVNEGLRELSFGDYEGHTEDELLNIGKGKEINQILNGNMEIASPNGESLTDLYRRVSNSLDEILKNNVGKKILIVSHGISIKAIISYFRGDAEFYSEIVGQGSLTKIIKTEEEYSFSYINNIDHIKEKNNSGW